MLVIRTSSQVNFFILINFHSFQVVSGRFIVVQDIELVNKIYVQNQALYVAVLTSTGNTVCICNELLLRYLNCINVQANGV
jgi:hypothetical protein